MGLPIGEQWTYFPLDVLACHFNIAGMFAKIYAPSQLLIQSGGNHISRECRTLLHDY